MPGGVHWPTYIAVLEPRYEYSEHCLQLVKQIKIAGIKPARIPFPVVQLKHKRKDKTKQFTHSNYKVPALNEEHTNGAATR
jgi:hypothetical protein